MRIVYGITFASDGQVVFARIAEKNGKWRLCGIERGNDHRIPLAASLLGRDVYLGLPAHWQRTPLTDQDNLTNTGGDSPFAAFTRTELLRLHAEPFLKNTMGIIPDDSFLCTIPLSMTDAVEESFLTLIREETVVKIGVTINKKLEAVFCTDQNTSLEGFFNRLHIYWNSVNHDEPLPRMVYLIHQEVCEGLDDYFRVKHIEMTDSRLSDAFALKSLGVALASVTTSAPFFKIPLQESSLRKLRSMAFVSSLAMTMAALLTIIIPAGLNTFYRWKIRSSETEYRSILFNNNEIRSLIDSGDSLSEKILHLQKTLSHPTRWAAFLQALGENRPNGLYYEQLGSEPQGKTDQVLRVALAGWATNETVVTEFLKTMQSRSVVSNITLASLERDLKSKDLYKFKIICTLQLEEN